MHYARFFADAAAADEPLRHRDRLAAILATETEMHTLEGEEMSLLSEADTLDRQAEHLAAVLQFQSVVEAASDFWKTRPSRRPMV